MATIKPVYNAVNTSLTLSGLSTLTSGSTVFSSAVSNASNLDLDNVVSGNFTVASTGVSSTGTIAIVIAASADGGGTYSATPANCKLLSVLTANVNTVSYAMDPASVAALYGGILPQYFKVGVTNNTGAALTAGNMFFAREQLQITTP